jgi:hypothetical protein
MDIGKIRSYSKEEIHSLAHQYLKKHFPQYPEQIDIPVDIELLIENDGYLISDMPDLIERKIDHEGLLLWNKTLEKYEICIVKRYLDPQKNYSNRYRFTLGEELGHLIMHAEYFKKLNSQDDAIKFYSSLSSEEIQRIDHDARIFAANILMPYSIIWDETKKLVEILKDEKRKFLNYNNFIGHCAIDLASLFEVSSESMEIRFKTTGIERDLLQPKYNEYFNKDR